MNMQSYKLRSKILIGALLSLMPSAFAQSEAGYKIFPKVEKTVPVELQLKSSDIDCTPVDFWGQSDLTIRFREVSGPTAFPVTSVGALFDGRCDTSAQILQSAAQMGSVKAGLYIKVYEYTEWGKSSDNGPYCTKWLKQFVYLTNNSLFPQYQYQASYYKKLEDLRYEDCASH